MKEKNEQIYEAGFQDGLTAASIGNAPRSDAAFYIGLLGGLFGLWGLAHILNGKVGMGCLWMLIVGPLLGATLGGVVVARGGLAGIIIIPLWLYIVYSQAKNGAARN
ncbi:MAG: hypothetical protein OXG92_08900 [Chloroflexi bacterium]|nr:hypothetical protein [Chloroflexota bacterium]MCY3581520.1 hypothetical protein [Chloroflexota bacterium]MCY3716566.1 hypothetical protein [Chloroflexota bacterium]MDE2651675.1 hypothetical protein [Chloroflexota bacterium]MXX51187.1 hypothetical protein [Chloroflexota bacterium]